MHRSLLLGLLVLSLIVTGCVRDPDPLELEFGTLTVHALLVAGSDSALVWVTRSTDPRLDSDRGPPYEGVRDAEVRVIAGGDTIWLVETPSLPCTVTRGISAEEGVGCYRSSLPASVLSGATYGLDIRLPDGIRATGQTVVPAPVTISAPAPDLRVTVTCPDGEYCYGENMDVPPYTRPVATVPLGWDLPPSVAGAHLALRPLAVYRDDVVYPGEACGLATTPATHRVSPRTAPATRSGPSPISAVRTSILS